MSAPILAGFGAFGLIVTCWLACLTVAIARKNDRIDDAVDDASRALGDVGKVMDHLYDTQPANGRHAEGTPAA